MALKGVGGSTLRWGNAEPPQHIDAIKYRAALGLGPSGAAVMKAEDVTHLWQPDEITASFLVVDIRGWSEIVYALGPDKPKPAARLVNLFWGESEPAVRAFGGEIYSWQGDALLVLFRGRRQPRLEAALKATAAVHAIAHAIAPECWNLLQGVARHAGHFGPVPRALQFAVSSAITDGKAASVPRQDGDRRTEELTGYRVNLVFDMVKEVPPDHVAISADAFDLLSRRRSKALDTFRWDGRRDVSLAGAPRQQIRSGQPMCILPNDCHPCARRQPLVRPDLEERSDDDPPRGEAAGPWMCVGA